MRILTSVLLSLLAAGCGDGGNSTPDQGMAPDMAAQPEGVKLEITCTDSIASIYADPGPLPADKGAIIHCAKDKDITANEIQALLTSEGTTIRPVTSGAHVYRILYRTERGDAANTPGYSSGLLFLPDTPRAAKLPMVVASHGSRGQAGLCAASKGDPAADAVKADFDRLIYAFLGYGYAVLAPDLAGYANYGAAGNPPSAYGSNADVGKSTLDGARAMKKLIPSSLLDQVALVGVSQGGATTLSALQLSDTYGAGAPVTAVVAVAPLWLTNSTWGGMASTTASSLYPFKTDPTKSAVSFWYMYTHGELLDGPGGGLEPFRPEKQAAVKAMVDGMCWDYPNWTLLNALGTQPTDVYTQAFTDAVGGPAAFGDPCPTDPTANAYCMKWLKRFAEDRPHFTGNSAKVPMIMLWGGIDTTIPYDRITCAIDRLKQDMVNLQHICVDPKVDHVGVLGSRGDYAADWLAARTLGGAEPANCDHDETAIVDPMGNPATCNMIPKND